MKAVYKTCRRNAMLLSGYFNYGLRVTTHVTLLSYKATCSLLTGDLQRRCLPSVSGLCCVIDNISARKLRVTDEYRLAGAIFTQIIAKWRNCSRKHAVVGAFYAAVILPFRPSFGNHFCNLNWAIWIDRCHLYRYRRSNKPRMACLSVRPSGR